MLRAAGVEARNLAGGMAAWARLLVATELERGPDRPTVVQYKRPASGCLSYLVADGGVGAVVDPLRTFADRYPAEAAERDLQLRFAVDTHVHADHLSGVRAVADWTGAEVVVPAGAREGGVAYADRSLADGDHLGVGDACLTAIAAPGHTSEMTVLRVGAPADPTPPVLLTGDSLFVDGVARPDLEDPEAAEGFAERLHDTLQTLLSGAGGSVVAPGHRGPYVHVAGGGGYTGTLDALAVRLDVLAADREAFVEQLTADVPSRPANHERIIAANLGEAALDEEAAFELELGPNNCVASGD